MIVVYDAAVFASVTYLIFPQLVKAISGSEIVWLKDLTAIFQTQKRIFGNTHLPDHLVFHVRRGSGDLILKLKRNYEIDPNADIFLVERTKEGRSILSKATTLERKVSFY
ncbi:hypothetical protein CHS0354_007212 [Potamilus streckersoni]|uniref:Uncharacterized protein n=1 Tax=Potamilus streckersoni TaxID=2493646 RepID=A0AAE0SLN0_9BIVA|nr:hypothetical protein CHS0354_007212 [Potamilus streckersoni]